MSHPADLIARAKALMLLGMTAKAVSAFAGVPHETVKSWRKGRRSGCVEPDSSIKPALFALIKGGIASGYSGENQGAPLRPQTGAAPVDSAPPESP